MYRSHFSSSSSSSWLLSWFTIVCLLADLYASKFLNALHPAFMFKCGSVERLIASLTVPVGLWLIKGKTWLHVCMGFRNLIYLWHNRFLAFVRGFSLRCSKKSWTIPRTNINNTENMQGLGVVRGRSAALGKGIDFFWKWRILCSPKWYWYDSPLLFFNNLHTWICRCLYLLPDTHYNRHGKWTIPWNGSVLTIATDKALIVNPQQHFTIKFKESKTW